VGKQKMALEGEIQMKKSKKKTRSVLGKIRKKKQWSDRPCTFRSGVISREEYHRSQTITASD
jgi:hypothetical protein